MVDMFVAVDDADFRLPEPVRSKVLSEVRPPVTLTDATTVATNAALGNTFRVTIIGDRTLGAPTNPTDAQQCIWEVTASGASRTLTLATGTAGSFKFGTDITSVPAISSGTTTIIGARYNLAADRWYVLAVASGF